MSVLSNEERPIEILTSDLWSTHLSETGPGLLPPSDAFTITVSYIIQVLGQNFEPEFPGLASKLKTVKQHVGTGYITTARRLELELLQAGKHSMSSYELFDDFIPQVRGLCDPLYSQQSFNPRSRYHTLSVTLVESLVKTFDNTPVNIDTEVLPENDATDFSLSLTDEIDPLDEFLENLDQNFGTEDDFLVSMETSMNMSVEQATHQSAEQTTSAQGITVDPSSLSRVSSSAQVPTVSHAEHGSESVNVPTSSAASPNASRNAESVSEAAALSNAQKIEANSCCEICGYRPKGDPQWFKGSMAKHRKLQHSTEPPRIYKCPFPGCTSAYKNRPDNLRQHQIEKGHFVDESDGQVRRPSKRKKPAE
jgi:hypothetical protein